ncbi:MAG: TolC family protein [Alistipes sp.]|nr:TolC family protein [Alistipes sp.]
MKNRYLALCCGVVMAVCGVSPLRAQITLDEYRQSVYDTNPEMRNAAEQVSKSYYDMLRQKSEFLPKLSASGSVATLFRSSAADDKLWGFALQPSLSQTIYNGGAVQAAYRQSITFYESSQSNEQAVWLYMRYTADYAYWNLSAQQLYKGAVDEYVSIIKSLYGVVQERFNEGYVAKSDLLQVEARLSDAEYSQIALKNQYDVALHSFNNLRSADQSSSVILLESIIDSIPMPRRMGADELAQRRPDIMMAKLAINSAQYGVKLRRAAYNPSIGANISGSWQTYTPNMSNKTFVDGAATISLSVPIFHWGERRNALSSARSDVRIAENNLENTYDDMLQEEADGWSALVNSYAQMQSSLKNLQIAGENLSISTYSYREGQATVLDVLQAQISWIQIYTNAITARFNYAVAVSAYMRITAAD